MIVHISAAAEDDLEAIGDYIAADNPRRALSFVQELRAVCLHLAATPEAFPVIPRYEVLGVRRRVHGDYLVFYWIEPSQVVVLHLLHGAMDYSAYL